MTTPNIPKTEKLPTYLKIVSEKNGTLELDNQNILHVLKAVDGSHVKENFPVAILSVLGSKEDDKLSIANFLIQKLLAGENEEILNNSTPLRYEQHHVNKVSNVPLSSSEKTVHEDQVESDGIYLWSQPFLMKMGVHACMKPLIIWIMYLQCTQERNGKLLETFVLKVCSKTIDVNWNASEFSTLEIYKRFCKTAERSRSIPLCSSFFYILRSNLTPFVAVDAKTTHDIIKIMRKHFPKQTVKYMSIIQSLSYFGLACVNESVLTLPGNQADANTIHTQKVADNMKKLLDQILDRSKLQPKIIGSKGQTLTLGKMNDFLTAVVKELNLLDTQHMQNTQTTGANDTTPSSMSTGRLKTAYTTIKLQRNVFHQSNQTAAMSSSTMMNSIKTPLKPISNTAKSSNVLSFRQPKTENKMPRFVQKTENITTTSKGTTATNNKLRKNYENKMKKNSKNDSCTADMLKQIRGQLPVKLSGIIDSTCPILNDIQSDVACSTNGMQQEFTQKTQGGHNYKHTSNHVIFHLNEASEIIMALKCQGKVIVQANELGRLSKSAHIALTNENQLVFGNEVLAYVDSGDLKWHWSLSDLYKNDTKTVHYTIPLEESDFVITSTTLLGLILKQLKQFLEHQQKTEYFKAIVTVPSWLSKDQIAQVEMGVHIAGFSEISLINSSSAIAQNYASSPLSPQDKGEYILLVENRYFIDVFVYSSRQDKGQIQSCSDANTVVASAGDYYSIAKNSLKMPIKAVGSLFNFCKTKCQILYEGNEYHDSINKQQQSCIEIENACTQAIRKARSVLGRDVVLIESVLIHREYSKWPSILSQIAAKLKLKFHEHKEFDAVLKGAVAFWKTGIKINSNSSSNQYDMAEAEIQAQKDILLKIFEKIEQQENI